VESQAAERRLPIAHERIKRGSAAEDKAADGRSRFRCNRLSEEGPSSPLGQTMDAGVGKSLANKYNVTL